MDRVSVAECLVLYGASVCRKLFREDPEALELIDKTEECRRRCPCFAGILARPCYECDGDWCHRNCGCEDEAVYDVDEVDDYWF